MTTVASSDGDLPFSRDSPYMQHRLQQREKSFVTLSKGLSEISKELSAFITGLKQSTHHAVLLAERMKGIAVGASAERGGSPCADAWFLRRRPAGRKCG